MKQVINNSPSVYFEKHTQNIRCNFHAKKPSINGIHADRACTVRLALTHVLPQLHLRETEKSFALTLIKYLISFALLVLIFLFLCSFMTTLLSFTLVAHCSLLIAHCSLLFSITFSSHIHSFVVPNINAYVAL